MRLYWKWKRWQKMRSDSRVLVLRCGWWCKWIKPMVHFIAFHRNVQRNEKDVTALLRGREGTCVRNLPPSLYLVWIHLHAHPNKHIHTYCMRTLCCHEDEPSNLRFVPQSRLAWKQSSVTSMELHLARSDDESSSRKVLHVLHRDVCVHNWIVLMSCLILELHVLTQKKTKKKHPTTERGNNWTAWRSMHTIRFPTRDASALHVEKVLTVPTFHPPTLLSIIWL